MWRGVSVIVFQREHFIAIAPFSLWVSSFSFSISSTEKRSLCTIKENGISEKMKREATKS
jgi:hypothetical protein